jgi:SAM-dependent methyltransferase
MGGGAPRANQESGGMMFTRDKHDQLQRRKLDTSRQRYEAGDPETRKRYDLTASLCMGRVLDIGCGQALLGDLLRSFPDVDYIGVDSWDVILHEAPEGVKVQLGDAGQLDFPAGTFDTVVLGQVLEHVFDERAAATEAVRVLKHGGRLIVNVPANETEPQGNHVRVFTLDSLQALFGSAVVWMNINMVGRFWFLVGYKA